MLKQIKALYDAGFAIHWLRPKSKVPLESGWTTGDRKPWADLLETYRVGLNVGVRLGTPSKVNGGYLAVIDVDVKSTDPKHRKEAYDYVKTLYPAVGAAPRVLTGRGNGSCHVYGRTRDPAETKRLSQSNETVKVAIPSADRPSKRELSTLSKQEIEAGVRLRPAWEVQVMGSGSQVVLPPSLHPDTGRVYKWATPAPGASELPLFDFSESVDRLRGGHGGRIGLRSNVDQKSGSTWNRAKVEEDFEISEVNLFTTQLSTQVIDTICSGSGVEDRSAALFSVCLTMIRQGFTDNQIATVLTDKDNFLGRVAYEHAKTDSRKRAAKWVIEQNLFKARRELDAAKVFDCEVQITQLNETEAEEQWVELVESDWRDNIERTTGPESKPKSTMKNCVTILRGELGDKVFTKNLFSGFALFGRSVPLWGAIEGAEITDENVVRIKKWIADKYRFEPATDKVNEAIAVIAAENSFHPVRDYLSTLEWDGIPRIDSWLKTYCNAHAEEPYLSAVSRKTLVAMIARIYEPGIKFDHVLILQGGQGYGKSTIVKFLAGENWFSDAHINISDKDGVLSMRAVWIVELGELSGMRKADVDQLKEFISRTTDRIRVPYGRRTENFPRQCIFIGTTNSDEYLRDVTGNRRFWPVTVGRCNFHKLKRDRDQLLAEAKFAYELGELLYLEDEKANEAAMREQEARAVHDDLIERLRDFFKQQLDNIENRFPLESFRMLDLFGDGANGAFSPLSGLVRFDASGQKRVGEALKKLGAVNALRRVTGRVTRVWSIDPEILK